MAGAGSAAAGAGALPARQFCMLAVKWQIEIMTSNEIMHATEVTALHGYEATVL